MVARMICITGVLGCCHYHANGCTDALCRRGSGPWDVAITMVMVAQVLCVAGVLGCYHYHGKGCMDACYIVCRVLKQWTLTLLAVNNLEVGSYGIQWTLAILIPNFA